MQLEAGREQSGGLAEVGQDRLHIENLQVQARVGVYDFEHEKPQTLRFDVEIRTVPGYLEHSVRTGEYVCYADPVKFIESVAASGVHLRLVEDWAERVAAHVLRNPLVDQVTVRVSKPDIVGNADGVGIRIVRRRA